MNLFQELNLQVSILADVGASNEERRILISIFVVAALVVTTGAILYTNQIAGKQRVTISTTTSFYDTRVLEVLKAEYEQAYPEVALSFISAGSTNHLSTPTSIRNILYLIH